MFTFDHFIQFVLFAGGVVLTRLWALQRDEVKAMREAIAAVDKRVTEAQDDASAAKAAADRAAQQAVVVAFEAGKALSEHKLYAAETFPRKDDVERYVDKVEERLASQIKENGEQQLARLNEIRDRLPRRT